MLSARRKPRRGIILMISMVTLILVTMIVGAAFTLLPSQLSAADHSGESVLAVAAAASGGDYAQSRMQSRPAWKGDMDGTGTMAGFVVNTPELQIYEDKGNVLGLMTQPDGSKRAFRIRFNFQNGGSTSPDDGFPDNPAATHRVNIAEVSANNIAGWAPKPLYKANSSGVVTSTVSDASIPKFESVVFVEGLAGKALRDATIDTLETVAQQRGVIRQVAQVRMGFLSQSRVDSAVYAGGDFKATSSVSAVLTNAPGAQAAHLRSLTNVTATGMNLTGTSTQSRVYYSGSTVSGVNITNESASAAAQNSRWLKLKWSEIPKASPTEAGVTTIKAGTYMWRQNTTTGNPELVHYNEDHPGTGVFTPTTSPTVIPNKNAMLASGSVGTAIDLDFGNLTTTISDKVYVEPNGPIKGIAVTIDPVYQATLTKRPAVILDPDPLKVCILSTSGSMFVEGKIEGVGSITTEGNLEIQGTSLFEADPDDAVVLYSRNDISVDSIPPTVAEALAPPASPPPPPGMGMGRAWGLRGRGTSAPAPAVMESGDVQFAGAVFAMGNFTTNITNGGLYVRGILSAYGGDPESQAPGEVAGTGNIDVKANRVEFMYDPTYLMNANNSGTTPAYLDRISWNLR